MITLCPTAPVDDGDAGSGLGPVAVCVCVWLLYAARLFASCIVCRWYELRRVRYVRSNQEGF